MTTHVLKVTLAHIRPPIWRRLAMTSETSLATLHAALQDAFGWEDSHEHEFRAAALRYGVPDPDDEELRDEAEATLAAVLPRKGAHLEYVYDLGDYWIHTITVEHIEVAAPSGARTMQPRRRAKTIECLAGERAAPPEDCGGPPGYAELLEALADTSHPEHAAMREWAGADFDPERVVLADISRRLARIA
ncbi:MAG TPA: plasmid pRiA4b ORF-3 family protein [Planctomycetota bacterium]|nr:plasmid pRiA4b ORF-3 family protein [Planctomycetota bacterium]